jgi:H+/Cl- antiporter ClcA
MFQVSPVVVVFGYIVIAAVGGIIGTLAGMAFSTVLKIGIRGAAKDAFLGAIGFVATVIGCAIIPWPRNTVSQSFGPGLHVETTLNRFQHSYIAATVVAVILPVVRGLLRCRRKQPLRSGTSQ